MTSPRVIQTEGESDVQNNRDVSQTCRRAEDAGPKADEVERDVPRDVMLMGECWCG